jgi:hypothetical protein
VKDCYHNVTGRIYIEECATEAPEISYYLGKKKRLRKAIQLWKIMEQAIMQVLHNIDLRW